MYSSLLASPYPIPSPPMLFFSPSIYLPTHLHLRLPSSRRRRYFRRPLTCIRYILVAERAQPLRHLPKGMFAKPVIVVKIAPRAHRRPCHRTRSSPSTLTPNSKPMLLPTTTTNSARQDCSKRRMSSAYCVPSTLPSLSSVRSTICPLFYFWLMRTQHLFTMISLVFFVVDILVLAIAHLDGREFFYMFFTTNRLLTAAHSNLAPTHSPSPPSTRIIFSTTSTLNHR